MKETKRLLRDISKDSLLQVPSTETKKSPAHSFPERPSNWYFIGLASGRSDLRPAGILLAAHACLHTANILAAN